MSAPGRGRSAQLGFAPRFNYLGGSSYVGEPINRIRLTARNQSTNEIVGTLVQDVNPNAQDWALDLDVALTETISVVVTVELINVTGGVEAVQWSGITAPISVTPASNQQPVAPVALFQGPPSNLGVVSVVAAPDSAVVDEGTTTTFTATIIGPSGATAVWSSSDPSVASVNQNGVVTGVRSGTASIIAVAGPKSDTVRVRVAQAIASIVVTPNAQSLSALGTEAVFTARVLDPRGAEIVGSEVLWSAADTSVARSVGNGRFIALRNGSTDIVAASVRRPNVRGTARLTVAQRAAGIDITPAGATLTALGATQTFGAVVRDASGNVMSMPITWHSDNPAVATIDAAGVATARGIGSTAIRATAGSGADTISSAATLHVTQAAARIEIVPDQAMLTAVGDTFVFTGVVRDANDNALPRVQLTWTTGNAGVAAVDENGRVIAVANGTTQITGSAGDLSASATVTVQQQIASIALAAHPDTAAVNDSVRLAATARDARGNIVAGASLLWTSSDTAVASVDASGLVRMLRTGIATITAGNGSVSASAHIVVRSNGPARLEIAADSIRINAIGFQSRLAASVYDDANRPLTGVVLAWSTLDPQIATVDANGLVTAVANGRARIVATANVADTATVNVQQVAAHVAAAPTNAVLAIGDTFRVAAAIADSAGTAMSGSVTWQSSNASIAAVDANGTIRGIANGAATITASFGGVTSNAISVSVNAANLTVGSLNVTPDTLIEGASAVITGVVRNSGAAGAAGSVASVRVLDAATGAMIVGGTVVVPSLAPGDSSAFSVPVLVDTLVSWPDSVKGHAALDTANAVIEANEADNTFTTSVHPVRMRVASVEVADSAIQLHALQQTAPVVPVLRDRRGRVLSGRIVSYAARNPSIVDVNAGGVVTALANGSTYVIATSETRVDSVRVDVAQVISSLSVTPASDTIASGDTLRLAAIAQDSNGVTVANASIVWQSNDTAVAVVGPTGVVTGRAVGAVTITADAAGHTATAALTVVAGVPSQITVDGGNNQHGIVDQFANDSLRVRVMDANGNPVQGAAVTWTPDSIGGQVSSSVLQTGMQGIAARPSLMPLVSYTNAAGIAKARWQLGRKAQAQTVTACTGAHCVTFHGRARPDRPSRSTKKAGADDQTVTVAQIAANALELTVADQFDNPVPNAVVQWALASGHGSLSASSTTTDTLGRATVQWTMPTQRGGYRVQYSVRDTLGVLVDTGSFRATAKPDKPHNHNRANDDQTVTVNQTAPNALELTLTDQFGNTIEGATVNWSLRSGHVGGVLSATTSTTDSAGKASVSWTNVGTKAGLMFVDYSVTHGDTTVSGSFKARARAARAAKGAKDNGDGQDVIVNRVAANALEVTVLDAFDNPTLGTVDWSVIGSGGTLSSSSTAVDTLTGKATVQWTMPTAKGRYAVVFTVKDTAGVAVATDTFKATAKPDKPVAANSARKNPGQSKHNATVTATLTDTVAVEFKDQYGNTVENVPVSWAKISGDSSAIGTAGTNTDTSGSVIGYWVLGRKSGQHGIRITAGTGSDTASIVLNSTTNPGAVRKLRFSQSSAQIDALADSTLVLTTSPADEFDNDVNTTTTWSSSDTSTVTVGANGKVHSKKNASAWIYGSAGGFTDSVNVAVQQRIKYLELNADTLTALQINKRLRRTQRDRNHEPIDSVYHEALTWSSSDITVATVDPGTGIVTSVANGFSTITAVAVSDNTVLANVVVEVRQAANTSGITFTGDTIVIVGDTLPLTANALDSNNRPVTRWTWSHSPVTGAVTFGGNANDQRGATINIIGQSLGTVTVTATDARGARSASRTITVISQPQ